MKGKTLVITAILIPSIFISAFTSAGEKHTVDSHTILIKSAEDIVRGTIKTFIPEQNLDSDTIPHVEVKLTPYLIYFDNVSNVIVVPPPYDELPVEAKAIIRSVAPDMSEAKIARFYHLLFNKFLVAHEAAHWIQHNSLLYGHSSLYASEQEANVLAAKYWSHADTSQTVLDELKEYLRKGSVKLNNPVPDGYDPEDYFNKNYLQLGAHAPSYGYFQFGFILEAINAISQ